METELFSLTKEDQKNMNFAMRVSFLVGILMLFIKGYAYLITNSAAIFSDAAESVVHLFAVGFAAYSMWLSFKPADLNHPYGHDKVTFFSAGFEGAMIIIASAVIAYEAFDKLIYGFEITNLDEGMVFIVFATLINTGLSYFLIRKGRQYRSIILEANGKHILTDCLTSFGVILALILVKFTGIVHFDPIISLLIASNILYTGLKLIKKCVAGLMDEIDLEIHAQLIGILQKETRERDLDYHNLKHRISGNKVFIEFHLLFPKDLRLEEAHDIASKIESNIVKGLKIPAVVFTHLEPEENHDEHHESYGLPI